MQDFSNLKFNQEHSRALHRQAQDRDVATGQKMILSAVLINLLVVAMTIVLPTLQPSDQTGTLLLMGGWITSIAAGVVAMLGLMRIGKGFDWPVIGRLAVGLLAFFPCINLIALLAINAMATTHLKASGYRVGLFGSRPKA